MATYNAGLVASIGTAIANTAQTDGVKYHVIVDGGPRDAAITVGLQLNGFVVFGGITYCCHELNTYTPIEVVALMALLPTIVNVSTGTMSATRLRLRGILPSEVALGSANNPPVIF